MDPPPEEPLNAELQLFLPVWVLGRWSGVVDQWNLRNVVGRHPALRLAAATHLDLDPGEVDRAEFAPRFTAYAPGAHSAIAGTAKLANLAWQRDLMPAFSSASPPE